MGKHPQEVTLCLHTITKQKQDLFILNVISDSLLCGREKQSKALPAITMDKWLPKNITYTSISAFACLLIPTHMCK